jgi:hypothetical protein
MCLNKCALKIAYYKIGIKKAPTPRHYPGDESVMLRVYHPNSLTLRSTNLSKYGRINESWLYSGPVTGAPVAA